MREKPTNTQILDYKLSPCLISALKMEQIESSETSANKNQKPGKHPKDSTLNTPIIHSFINYVW
jgi:hypothetical protein